MLSAKEIKDKTFPTTGNRLFGEWYDADAVDDFLDKVCITVATLETANRMLMRQTQQSQPSKTELS